MKKYWLNILFLFSISGPVIAQPNADIHIVSENQRSITLEYTPSIKTVTVIGNRGTKFTRFDFQGSQAEYDSASRECPVRTVQLVLPSADYILQVLSSNYQIADSVNLVPRPRYESNKDFGLTEIYDEKDLKTFIQAETLKPLSEIVQVSKTGFGHLGTLILRPIRNIGKEKVKLFSKIVVKIDFKVPFTEGVLSSNILNGILPRENKSAAMKKAVLGTSILEDSPLSQGDWYRIGVREKGMYKLDYNYFQSLGITVDNINYVRVFGNGGDVIPEQPDYNAYPRPSTLLEVPRLVVDKDGDGKFDPEDYVVFYGRGVERWIYKGGGAFQHRINPYTEINYYFFSVNNGTGLGMDSLSGTKVNPAAYSPSNFKEKIFVEEEKYNLINSGRLWVGKLFSGASNSATYFNSLPGLDNTFPINYEFNIFHRSSTTDFVYTYDNGQQLAPPMTLSSTSPDINDFSGYAREEKRSAVLTGGVPNNTSVVKIEVSTTNPEALTWLDWIEIFYQRKFEAQSDALIFTAKDTSGAINYSINNLSSEIRAYDLTSHDSVKQITQLDIIPGSSATCSFQLQQQINKIREIAVVGMNGYKNPPQAVKIENTNLHGISRPVDFIIISPKEFSSEANRLKEYREANDTLATIVADIEQVYNEFSGGLPDPLAIREFLRYSRNNWGAKYALLLGWGHYDYKNKSTSEKNWIPVWESEEKTVPFYSYPSDDCFVLDSSGAFAMAIGRLPARNLNEARITINKIISYRNNAAGDPWCNKINFVADDGHGDGDEGSIYTNNTDDLAENYTPKSYEKRKLYIVRYETVKGASGNRKPNANKVIVEAINQGALITNFIGHGNQRLWTHEAVFTQEDDIPRLSNKEKLSFFITATCSYGYYDDPKDRSAAEQLICMEGGGGIAIVTSARKVYNNSNVALNRSIFGYLLYDNALGGHYRLGEAWMFAKRDNYADRLNVQKFHLFGDPTLRILAPRNEISIDSVDGKSPDITNVAIKSLDHIKVKGTVKNDNGTTMSSFNGTGVLQFFDSKKEIRIVDGINPSTNTFIFTIDGDQLYNGYVTIANGTFSADIPVPKDVTFGNTARLSLYAWGNQTDGVGYTENVKIDGIDTAASLDKNGPDIVLYLNEPSFHAGNIVKKDPLLIVQLQDESGINTSKVGIGHRLSAVINNPERNIDLSDYYHNNLDTYKSGEVRFQIRDLADGKYSLKIKAWDIYNNSSETETFFEVNSNENIMINNVLNYPNPFSNSTTFTFRGNSTEPLDVEVKIYTITGRLINIIKTSSMYQDVQIGWDGKDNDGALLANGVYFYKIMVTGQVSRKSCETIGKLVIMH